MKRVSYSLKKTSLLMMIGLQMIGLSACGSENKNKVTKNAELKVDAEASDVGEDAAEKDLSNEDITKEISFELPEELTIDKYDNGIGLAGGCVFQPDVYEGGSEVLPAEWLASGMVSRYEQANVLSWDGTMISTVNYGNGSSIMEFLENVNDLAAPAILMHGNHNLFTSSGMEKLQEQGVDFSSIDLTSDYWFLFIAKPDEKYGYVITLNQKNYSRDDILAIGKSIKLN